MNFKDLDSLIHSNGRRITLTSDVILEDGEELIYKNGIDITSDALIIDGMGHSIDAGGKARIFNIRSKLQVVLKNIIFKNASHSQGGAINNYSKFLTIGCCTFENNTADDGGAIYNNAYLKAIGCNFIDNNSKYSADIYNWDMLILRDCEFKNENSNIIFSLNELTAEECRFEGHHKIEKRIFEFSEGAYEVNDESSNDDEVNGGAEKVFKQLQRIIDSLDNYESIDEEINQSLNSDNVNDFIDGAIDSIDDYNEIVHDITESRKRHKGNETAIGPMSFTDLKELISQNNEVFLDCDVAFGPDDECLKEGIFLGSKGKDDSSAVFLYDDLVIDGQGHSIDAKCMARIFVVLNEEVRVTFRDITFKNAYFHRRQADGYLYDGGGVIYNEGNCRFEFCEFLNCHVSFSGGAVYNYRGEMSFFECIFDKNHSDGPAGVVFNNSGDMEFINCIFTNNSSVQSGAVLCDFLGKLKFNRCCFKHNSTEFKGIISLGHNVSFDFEGSIFSENTVRDGLYIYKTGFF